MKFSLKSVAIAALATAAVAAPVEKRDAASDRLISCFIGLVFTGAWPGSCQAAVAVDLGLIKSITLNQMSMDFTGSNPWAPSTSSSDVVATMLGIPGISLPITKIRQHIILGDGAKQLGNLETPFAAASVNGATLKTSFPSSPLAVFSDAHAAFSSFVGSISSKASHTITLKGSVDAELNLGIFGKTTINGIGFNTQTPLAGLNNLQLTYKYPIDFNFDAMPLVKLSSIIEIVNPSKLSLKLGDVSFSTATPSGYIGVSTIKNLSLVPGKNIVISTTALESNLPAATEFMNNLYTQDGQLSLTGFSGSSTNPALNGGLAAINSKLVVPKGFEGTALSQPPSKDWSLKVLSNSGSTKKVQVKATFQSPYYGYSVKMVRATSDLNDNSAFADAVIPGFALFRFDDSLQFEVSGTGTTTVTFTASLSDNFTPGQKAQWQTLANYAAANGKIPVNFNWLATVIVNNDGVNREADWGTGLSADIAVGSDFAQLVSFL
ncbi:hypothetical protein BGX34_003751 [Mortierella sp. NVP85]|nr:hypothetical protein BGX34_003751 [Mortierella sp. NVP85]